MICPRTMMDRVTEQPGRRPLGPVWPGADLVKRHGQGHRSTSSWGLGHHHVLAARPCGRIRTGSPPCVGRVRRAGLDRVTAVSGTRSSLRVGWDRVTTGLGLGWGHHRIWTGSPPCLGPG